MREAPQKREDVRITQKAKEGDGPMVTAGNLDFPRRCRIDLMSPAELAIREAVIKVEEVGAHPLLTDAVVLLDQARNKVADYLDLTPDTGASQGVRDDEEHA